jgi:hypothetical protein
MGGVVSCTVTVKLHWLLFPDPSHALHNTVVTPRGKSVPEGGVQTTVTLLVPQVE